MSKRVTSYELRVTRKARYPFFDESRDFIANRFKRPATRNPRPATSRGFTLLELMVVIIIMGIVSTTCFLSARGFLNKAAVKNATRDIASVMRIAHSKAGALKKPYVVVFDNQEPPDTQARVWAQSDFDPADTGTWKAAFGTEKKLSNRVQIASVEHSWNPGEGGTGYQEIDDPMQIGYLTFYWDGGSIPITVVVCDTKNNNQYGVTVDYATSRVKITEYD